MNCAIHTHRPCYPVVFPSLCSRRDENKRFLRPPPLPLSLSLSIFYHRYTERIVGAYESARLRITGRPRGFINISHKKVLHQFALYAVLVYRDGYDAAAAAASRSPNNAKGYACHIRFGHYSPSSGGAGVAGAYGVCNECLRRVRGGECTSAAYTRHQ